MTALYCFSVQPRVTSSFRSKKQVLVKYFKHVELSNYSVSIHWKSSRLGALTALPFLHYNTRLIGRFYFKSWAHCSFNNEKATFIHESSVYVLLASLRLISVLPSSFCGLLSKLEEHLTSFHLWLSPDYKIISKEWKDFPVILSIRNSLPAALVPWACVSWVLLFFYFYLSTYAHELSILPK